MALNKYQLRKIEKAIRLANASKRECLISIKPKSTKPVIWRG